MDAGDLCRALNLGSREAFQKAFSDLSARFPDANFVVQEQCPAGTEIIIGIKREEGIGPVMMFGLGGIYVEMLKDVSFCLAPLSHTAITSTKSYIGPTLSTRNL